MTLKLRNGVGVQFSGRLNSRKNYGVSRVFLLEQMTGDDLYAFSPAFVLGAALAKPPQKMYMESGTECLNI